MPRQNRTGHTTEERVKAELEDIGLCAKKPKPDRGIDLVVTLPGTEEPVVKIQVKGRGANQKNKRYRWFQIRTTEAQRKRAVADGIPVEDTWEKKVRLCDFFVLVAEKYDEFWVLPQSVVIEIGRINRKVYGNRADNRSGQQAELDLDIEKDGKPLADIYSEYKNAFSLIEQELWNRIQQP